MRAEGVFINIHFVQTKVGWLIVEPQHIKATIPRLANGMAVVVFTRSDEGVDVLCFYLNVNPHHKPVFALRRRGC